MIHFVFVSRHESFAETFRFFAFSHFYAAMELSFGLLLYAVYKTSVGDYGQETWAVWILAGRSLSSDSLMLTVSLWFGSCFYSCLVHGSVLVQSDGFWMVKIPGRHHWLVELDDKERGRQQKLLAGNFFLFIVILTWCIRLFPLRFGGAKNLLRLKEWIGSLVLCWFSWVSVLIWSELAYCTIHTALFFRS